MMIDHPNRKQVFRSATGAMVLLSVVGLIFLLGAPGCGEDDNNLGDTKSNGTASRVPKTGQTECWDEDGNKIDCKGTGQDGEYQLGVLPVDAPIFDNPYTVYGWTGIRFTDNNDGTVTDNLTGLIWLKNANCFGWQTWTEALSDCNNLASGSCGLTDWSSAGDWRLPNVNELHSLVDPTQRNPPLPEGYPFTAVQHDEVAAFYWASTTRQELYYQFAWCVNMAIGILNTNTKRRSDHHYVWPVRSGN